MKLHRVFLAMIIAVLILLLLGGASQQSVGDVLVGEWTSYTLVDTVEHEMQWTFTDTSFSWRIYEMIDGGLESIVSATGTWTVQGMVLRTEYSGNGVVEMFQISYSVDQNRVVLQYDADIYCILYKKPE